MPPIREEPLGLHPLDEHLHREVLVAGFGDPALYAGTRHEGPFEPDAEPAAELLGVTDRAPDPRLGRAQHDLLLDAISVHRQPPGCILAAAAINATARLQMPVAYASLDADRPSPVRESPSTREAHAAALRGIA